MTRLRLLRTGAGPAVERDGTFHLLEGEDWDALLARDDLPRRLRSLSGRPLAARSVEDLPELLPPVVSQEVWACGVTYRRSREARLAESGGGDFYARVYEATRPEIFFKATAGRVAGHRQPVRVRTDSRWSVPEPELALLVSSGGRITGYTVGNDLSARDIEAENPLYLPQAKIYDGCCALGPGILVSDAPLPADTGIHLQVHRAGELVEDGRTTLEALRRRSEDLVGWLTRECSFPSGAFLLTGTGVVPAERFALVSGDEITISIDHVGILCNTVA